jgi:hypothetical protein
MANKWIKKPDQEIWLEKWADDNFLVRWDLHGWQDSQRCDSEHQAITFMRGFKRGYNAVKNVIGIGPREMTDIHEGPRPENYYE